MSTPNAVVGAIVTARRYDWAQLCAEFSSTLVQRTSSFIGHDVYILVIDDVYITAFGIHFPSEFNYQTWVFSVEDIKCEVLWVVSLSSWIKPKSAYFLDSECLIVENIWVFKVWGIKFARVKFKVFNVFVPPPLLKYHRQ